MKLLALYLRARLLGHALLCLTATSAVGAVGTRWMLTAPVIGENNASALVPAMLFLPLASAAVVGVSTQSPFRELERTAPRSTGVLRFAHLGGPLLFAAVTLCALGAGWDHPQSELTLLRNLCGFVGLALLAAPVLGSRLSWVVPFCFGALALLRGALAPGEFAWWAWPLRPGGDEISMFLAALLLVTGLVSVCSYGGFERPGEAE